MAVLRPDAGIAQTPQGGGTTGTTPGVNSRAEGTTLMTQPAPATPPPATTTPAPAATPAAPAAPAPGSAGGQGTTTLGTDPLFLNYMRQLGITDADAQAAAQQASARIGARLTNSLSDAARANQVQGVNLGTRLETSGQGTGSMGSYAAANLAQTYGARQEALRQAAADQLATLVSNLALNSQKGATGAAQAALTAAPTVSDAAAAANNYGVTA